MTTSHPISQHAMSGSGVAGKIVATTSGASAYQNQPSFPAAESARPAARARRI